MMVCVHAAVGAALGAVVRRPWAAFACGVASHLICDLLPHRDYDMKIEAPLATAVFAYLARRYGVDSPQFLGACGAVAPDFENALTYFGVIQNTQMVFPTHNNTVPWFAGHGDKVDSPASQVALAAIALAIAEAGSGGESGI